MRLLFTVTAVLALMTPITVVHAATGWISDVLYVPLRSGAGNQYRIVHRGLRSGTELEILEWPEEENEWARVRVNGNEGWIQSQYISRAPTAAIRLSRQEQRVQQLESQLQQTREQLEAITAERNTLRNQVSEQSSTLAQQSRELERLNELAAEPLRLDEANRELNEELSLLRSELDQARAESALLRNDQTFQGWLLALATVFAGMLLGWYFKSRASQKRSSWT